MIQFFAGASPEQQHCQRDAGEDVILLLGNMSITNSPLFGGAGDGTLDADVNSLSTILFGSNGNKTIIGGSNVDGLRTGAGDDFIRGGLGADRMYGEDVIEDFNYAGGLGQAETGNVATGAIDQLLDFTSGADVISGFGTAGDGEFALAGGADATYALVCATMNASAVVADYVPGVYGSGSAWTAVLFTEIGK